ncbi:MAG: UDP-2,3-diacylglucosamine diphosphatase [Nevskiaceae bacterium]|nr:MAG: UDP-2,3-diacylglucosamine diphosphatase [Nevskiaceae bacterium]TBR71645.1 MAG: UDP-2,3-diacylglucosamine diphosphatase [Nevskiaceae bacterium]
MKNEMKTATVTDDGTARIHYRTVWISDVHLGTAGCRAEQLTAFLKSIDCDTLYLVGDIIDGWRLRSTFYWPQAHSNVVRSVLTKAKRGTRVVYVTGNHDEFLRKFTRTGLSLGNIEVVDEAEHRTADGRRLLVLHGDVFDTIVRHHRWLAVVGDVIYDASMEFSRRLNKSLRLLGMKEWSLSAFAKRHVKIAVNVVSNFEDAVATECRRRDYDGIVSGHIHHAEIRDIAGIQYHNCGDWVENCTALVENERGDIEILRWPPAADVPLRSNKPLQKSLPALVLVPRAV